MFGDAGCLFNLQLISHGYKLPACHKMSSSMLDHLNYILGRFGGNNPILVNSTLIP